MERCRVAVIGIDAADLGFLQPWMDEGELPVLAGLFRDGASGPLRSTVPPVSAPAWATFMTGRNPGGHGLFDFVVRDPRDHRPVLARYDLVQGPRLWDAAGAAGRRSVVVGVPVTWPPAPLDGFLVTGMLTPEGRRDFTHPPELAAEIMEHFPRYRCDVDVGLKEVPEALRAHLDDLLLQNAGLMRWLLRRGPWDLFVGVFTTTDRCKHFFWHERETVLKEHYRKVDRAVGDLLGQVGEDALVVVLSDHGFHDAGVKFYLNRWLEKEGLLATRARERDPDLPDEDLARGAEFLRPARVRRGLLARLFGGGDELADLEVDLARSRAFMYSVWTGGIQIHLRGRSLEGTVAPEEYEPLRDRLIDGLRALRHPEEDRPLFEQVGRREEFYRGPCAHLGPDVVTRSEGCRVLYGKNLDRGRILRVSRHPIGTHSDTGLVAIRGPGVRPGARLDDADLEDIMPTVLWALGVPRPGGVDGRVLVEAFTDDHCMAHPVGRWTAAPAEPDRTSPEKEFTPEEEEEIRRTLEGLGYL